MPLVATLAKQENQSRLAERALKTPLQSLETFLLYTKRTIELKPIHHALVTALARQEAMPHLVELALVRLDDLKTVLKLTRKTDGLVPVFVALVNAMARSENQTRLTDCALKVSLRQLVRFLEYTLEIDELNSIFQNLCADLSNEVNRKSCYYVLFAIP
jgi:hypothetical protein